MSILLILAGLKRLLESIGFITQVYGVPEDDSEYPVAVIEVFKTTKEHIHAGTVYRYHEMVRKGYNVSYGGEYKVRLRLKLYDISLNNLTKKKRQVLLALEKNKPLDISDKIIGYEIVEDEQIPIIEKLDVGLEEEEINLACAWNGITDREKATFEMRVTSQDSYSYSDSGKTVWGEIINLNMYYIDDDNVLEEYDYEELLKPEELEKLVSFKPFRKRVPTGGIEDVE